MKSFNVILKLLLAGIFLAAFSGFSQYVEYYPEWIKTDNDTSGVSQGQDITIDSDNNVISVSQVLSEEGQELCVIHKVSSDGTTIWRKHFEVLTLESFIYGADVEVDSDDNIFLVGKYEGNVDFDPGPGIDAAVIEYNNPFILKLNSEGEYQWCHYYQEYDPLSVPIFEITNVVIDKNDEVVVAGAHLWNTVDLSLSDDPADSLVISNDLLYPQSFILRLDNDGNWIWGHKFEVYSESTWYAAHFDILDLTCDINNHIIASGYIVNAEVDLDPTEEGEYIVGESAEGMTGLHDFFHFVFKLNEDNEIQWGKTVRGSTNIISDVPIATDNTGSIYTAGADRYLYFYTETDTLFINTSSDSVISYIQKLDTEGNREWLQPIKTLKTANVASLATDYNNNVLLSGWFTGGMTEITGEDIEIPSANEKDTYFHILNPDGFIVHSQVITGDSTELPSEFLFDLDANIIGTGTFYKQAKFCDYDDCERNSDVRSLYVVKYSGGYLGEDENEHHVNHNYSAYPNPTSEFVSISGDLSTVTNIAIYDMTGKRMEYYDNNFDLLHISSLPKGMYVIKINTENNSYLEKLIIN
ncbi:T9SS type A sorting domain-containing protein [Crocinitomix algicola]|uniref:T9SS type A sorting domain-containing protein n=1 Tax=Crocinitomix algicola TaxID=1740263 RepID=UPI00083018A1|nr:T9SS type A sorting domain-containing protein [Crocinitomix algicola]